MNSKTNANTKTRSPSPKNFLDADNENSPLRIACTQESSENIDVVWDWNSPTAKKPTKKRPKRLLTHSPKVPLKKHPSSSNIQDYEKLGEELRALREELAKPDHEESLRLSPIEEKEYKSFNERIQQLHEHEFDDLLDDSMNQQLLAFSQQIEEDLKGIQKKDSPIPKKTLEVAFEDDLDDIFKSIDVPTKFNENKSKFNYKPPPVTGKVEFCRTQSFEMMDITRKDSCIKICTAEEIERKRLEALAKLQSKRKGGNTNVSSQCSAEEIEQKRLQALAKIESKRQQEIIEMKRQEALKRLQMKRQRNATSVKSSLATRLN